MTEDSLGLGPLIGKLDTMQNDELASDNHDEGNVVVAPIVVGHVH